MTTPVQKGASPLRPKARIIRTIGEELISNDIVAVLELVKNSYDADSPSVEIVFSGDIEKSGGNLTIKDKGTGMKLETIQNAWFEPATNFKRLLKKTNKGRRILGEKGIGRFAAAKLSNKMEMITKTKDDNEIVAVLNWEDFGDEKKYLDEIECSWEVRSPKNIKEHGTILKLIGLTSAWDEEKIKELRLTLSRLINPFSPIKGFEIELKLPEKFKDLSGKIEPPPSLGKPDYYLKGEVTKKGKLTLKYFSKMLNEEKDISPSEDFVIKTNGKTSREPTTGPFSFEFRVWNRESESLKKLAKETGSKLRDIRRDLNEASGISIYRDGFRVLPYGEPENDWLRLDMRRVQNPTRNLSNNQIVGYVFVSLDENPELKDQSNREGIVESQQFSDLKESIKTILTELEKRRFKERRPTDKTEESAKSIFESFDFSPVTEIIQTKLPKDEEAKKIVKETDEKFKKGVKQVQEIISRYRRLSTLGQLLDVVLHDGNTIILRAKNETQILKKEFKKETINEDSVNKHIDFINNELKIMGELFKRLEPFSGRKRGRPKNIVAEESIKNVFELFKKEITKLDVDVDLPDSETVVRFDESEFEIMIVNLLQNSLYWLERVNDRKRKIIVEILKKEDEFELIFSDNGPGVKEDDAAYIFDPYFSTKPDGVGLGLTIVGELVTEYDGNLDLITDGPLDGATFRMIFRRRI